MQKVLVLVLVILALLSAAHAAPQLKVGVAVTDITPPVGYRMSGYFSERFSTGVHDPLQAKAMVLLQGNQKAAMVFCDLIGISADVSRRARELAGRRTGIPASNILVAATHSHTGPLYFDTLRNYFHELATTRDGKDAHETIEYADLLVERLVDAIVRAEALARPAQLAAAATTKTGLSYNRRFHMKDGTVVFNPGKLNPNIVRPAGPIDPDVGILLARSREKALASLTSFALHLDTVGGTEYGADYPFYLQNWLRRIFGADFISLFGNGACGDINHVDVSHDRPQKGHQEAERIGSTLGQVVQGSLSKLAAIEKPSLNVRSAKVRLPLQEFSSQQVARARENLTKVGTRQLPFLTQVESVKILDVQLRQTTQLQVEVQAFRLGPDTAIVALPGEVFVELGLAVKQASPFKQTFVIELCNDDIAYVPTRKAFAEGSYETINSMIKPGGGEMLVEMAVRLLRELK